MSLHALRALSNDKRLLIMEWLKEPKAHFPPQVYGDLVRDGVCGQFIAEKLGVTAATASAHLNQLVRAGILKPTKVRQWVFYKRDEKSIQRLKRALSRGL